MTKNKSHNFTRPFRQTIPLSLLIAIFFIAMFAFRASAGEIFSVSEFSPQGLVTGPTNIRIDFSTPVVASNDVGSSPDKTGLPVLINPAISGQGLWVSRSTFLYQLPNGYIQEATEFTATIPPKLKDYAGKTISGERTFRFNTEPLKFLGIRQTDYRMNQSVEYELRFNAPLDVSNLKKALSVKNKNGEAVSFAIRNYGSSNNVTMEVTPDDGSPITFEITSGLNSSRGSLPMQNPVSVTVNRDLSMKVTQSLISNYYFGSSIVIRTTTEVDAGKASQFIELTPARPFNISTNSSELIITGDFPPRELITVKLSAGLPSTQGEGLSEAWEQSFIFPDYEPSLELATLGHFISPANEELIVPFASVNVGSLTVAVDRVYDNNVSFITKDEWPYYLNNVEETIYNEKFDISSEPNKRTEFSIDLGKILNGRTGLFMVRAMSGEYWPRAQRLINVTDIAGSAKIGNAYALVWANSIKDGKPLKNVKVDLYSANNQVIASGITDEHGVFSIKRQSDWDSNLLPNTVLLKKDDDVSVLRLQGNIWQIGNDEYGGAPYLRNKYEGFIYTPRGIFRPGETVPVRLLVRNPDLSPETPFPVQLKIFNSMGREWSTSTVTLSEFGMASADVRIADSGPTGAWTARIFIPGDESSFASTTFLVEDFAPPKIEVSASSDQAELHYGDEPALNIFSQYLFGASGANLDYEVETTLIPREYSHPDWPDYTFSDYRVPFTPNNDLASQGKLSHDGTAKVTLNALTHQAKSILDASFTIGVREEGGRWVYKNLSLPYYPRGLILGIKYPKEVIPTGANIPFAFAAVDILGKPLSPKVTLTVYQERSRDIITTVDGERRSELRKETVLLEGFDKKAISFEGGHANEDVLFHNPGYYSVILEDEENTTSAAVNFYVYDSRWGYIGDEGDATLPESLSIKLDKDIYRAGEKATAVITGAFKGTMLLSVETDKILHYDTSTDETGRSEFTFEVTRDMAPNAWVTAHLVRAAVAEDAWSAHRAFGAVPLNVDCSDIKLSVEITSPEKIRPAEPNNFKISLTDSNGNGTQGEISVMLVDEGVLGLTSFKTPNFYSHYTRKRALTLYAYDIYTELMPLYLKKPPILKAGGGDDGDAMASTLKASLSPVKANRFKILTIVNDIMTDEQGKVEISIDVPEFSGRARLMALASSKKSFGSGEQIHTIARDVITDVTLPRVLAPRDTFDSQIHLFNRTGAPIDVTINLDIDGPISIISIDRKDVSDATSGEKSYTGKLTLPPGERPFVIPTVMKADDESGMANVTLKTTHANASQNQDIGIAIRPPFPRITKTGAATVKPGETNLIEMPMDWFPGTRRALISMSGLPAITLSDAAKFLLDYPYWCLEQTVSKGWTLLAAPELAAQIDTKLAAREHLEYQMSHVLLQIQSMQLYNGSFSPWPLSYESQWLSVYVTHFLVECEKEGIVVPRETLKNAMEYLRYLLAETPETTDKYIYGGSLSTRAYISYVMAQKGEAPLAWMSYLRDNINFMPQYGRILLAAAYGAANDNHTAISLIGEQAPSLATGGSTEHLNLNSPLRTQALYLMAWNEIDSTSPSAVTAAANLLNSLRASRWYTTHEASWALIALSVFYSSNTTKGDAILSMSEEHLGLLAVTSGDKSTNQTIDYTVSSINLSNSGTGIGYATWTVDGVPIAPPIPEDLGIKAAVRYLNADNFELSGESIVKNGERIYGEIILLPLGGKLEDIVISLPLAGGLEIENPKNSGSQYVYDETDLADSYNNYTTSRTEIRDDRLLLFVDNVEREFKWKFSMRAITSGTFTLPPIAAEGMYSPGTRSIGATSRITIR